MHVVGRGRLIIARGLLQRAQEIFIRTDQKVIIGFIDSESP